MKRARRIIRRLLAVVLLLGVLCLIGLGVLNYYVLPRYGPGWITSAMEGSLGRRVEFEQVDWNVLRGATITGLVVQPRADVLSGEPFAEVGTVEARFRIASLVPFRVELQPELSDVHLRLIKSAGGEWNFADIVDRLTRERTRRARARLGRLGFSQMTIEIEDRYAELPVLLIDQVSCELTTPSKGSNHLKLAGRWGGRPGRMTLDATFGAGTRPVFKLGLGGPVICELQQLLAPEGPLFARDIDGLASFVLTQQESGALSGRAELSFDAADLEVEGFHIRGAITGSVDEITIEPGRDIGLTVSSAVQLTGGHIDYVPPPSTASVDEPGTGLRDVTGLPPAGETPETETRANPASKDSSGATTADEKPVPQMTYVGDGTVGLLLAGTVGERLSVTVACTIGDATVTTPALHAPFRAIGGTVTYDGTGLKYENVVGEIEGAVVTVDGAIDAFGEPNITFDVDGDRIGGHARLRVRHVKGQRLPAFQVDGAAWMDAPLARLLVPPNVADALDRLHITGMVSLEGSVGRTEPGLVNVWARGTLGGQALGVRGFGFDGITGDLYLERGLLKLYNLKAALYDGRFAGAWESDFAAQGMPFKLDAALQTVDIARMPLLPKVEERGLSGRLGANVLVNGELDDLPKNFGKGSFRLKDGYVWELSVFKELFNVLSVRMPGLVRVVFSRARGDFRIEGLTLKTTDLYFQSDLLQLLFDGTIGLDGRLDFVVDPVFFREKGGPIRQLVRGILNIPANIIPRALIKGTVNHPVVKPYLRPRLPILNKIIR